MIINKKCFNLKNPPTYPRPKQKKVVETPVVMVEKEEENVVEEPEQEIVEDTIDKKRKSRKAKNIEIEEEKET